MRIVENGAPKFRIALVLGGARSGKSRYGLSLAAGFPAPRLFVATGEARDEEMAARIAHHRKARGPGWDTVEAPLALAAAISSAPKDYSVILVDCLTLWLSNLMLREDASVAGVEQDCEELLMVLKRPTITVVLISNEVGWGIVPDHPLAREFRDRAGWLHQRLGDLADLVALTVAGLPVMLKGG